MASSVFYKASVEKDLRKLDPPAVARLLNKLEQVLSHQPHAGEPLSGEFQGLFKYRIGDYRIVYAKIPEGILVARIRRRREVYR